VGLILVALTLEPDVDAMRAWFVVALVLSLIGDIFLMLPQDLFLPGLVSFLLGHLAYIAGFLASGLESGAGLAILGALLAIPAVRYAGFLLKHMTGPLRPMRVPLVFYTTAIATMLMCAVWSGSAVAAAGALLFVTSDGLIGYSRFVRAPTWAPVAIIVTYHLGQAGLVLSLVHL
jgi:uncharacterized membrane protein YhhN